MTSGRGAGIWRSEPPSDGAGYGVSEFIVLSALMLFWEICLIRWISTEIRVFAYYKNLSLLGAFLGFGVGLLRASDEPRWLRDCVARLTALVLIVVLYPVSPLRIDQAPAFFQEFTWHPRLASVGVAVKFYAVILLIFLATAYAFVPWGRRIGFYFEKLRPIPAYSLNIVANLVGIGVFSALSVAGTPPVVWVTVGLLPLVLVRGRKALGDPVALALAAVPILLTSAQATLERNETHWSPYYKIEVVPPGTAANAAPFHVLNVNHDYHQRILDLRPATIESKPELFRQWALAYDLAYRVGQPGRVLVIGAGTGNDVAAALRNGATSVEAVEIDPVIQRIGKRLHPERPYDSSRVRVSLCDARTFLSNPPPGEPFDIAVFGLLDSHTQVSGMNSLRLDNFIYTVEAFAQARALLHPERGLLAVSFSAGWGSSGWTLRRIYRMLLQVFGAPPRMVFTGYDAGVTFLAGPATANHPYFDSDTYRLQNEEARKRVDGELARTEPVATDDWPFLYMAHRAVPLEYWIMMALIGALSAAWVWRDLPQAGPGGAPSFSLHFFFLGGAFLLVEVKNLVELSLLFGSTWQVNNLAIGAILVMILLANLVAQRARTLDLRYLYAVLLATLVLGCVLRPAHFSGLSRAAQVVLVPLYLSIPIFVAGLVFIRSFSRTAHPASALGANILGGIFGGLVENASLALGIHALQYLALALYGLSFLAVLKGNVRGGLSDEG